MAWVEKGRWATLKTPICEPSWRLKRTWGASRTGRQDNLWLRRELPPSWQSLDNSLEQDEKLASQEASQVWNNESPSHRCVAKNHEPRRWIFCLTSHEVEETGPSTKDCNKDDQESCDLCHHFKLVSRGMKSPPVFPGEWMFWPF